MSEETEPRRRTKVVEPPPADPRVEHKKGLAKKEQARQKEMSAKGMFYTENNGKILRLLVKANGTYSTYIGKAKLMKDFIARCKAQNTWAEQHQVKEFVSKIRGE